MKFTLTALAVLGLAVANPVIQKRALPSIPGLSIGNDGKGTLPRASAAVCKAGSGSCCREYLIRPDEIARPLLTSASGKTSCFDGWSCYQFQNHDVCIPPGWNYDGKTTPHDPG